MAHSKPRLVALFSSAALVAALLLMPAAVGAAGGGDSASGHATQGSTSTDFSARSTNTNTDARGRIRLTNTSADPNDVWTAEVTCMRVFGATATTFASAIVIGRIVDQPPGSGALSIIVHATDSGKFNTAPDGLISFLSSAPAPEDGGCPTTTPFFSPLAEGEITISNTLP